jgi:hypothetical protein
VLGVKRTHILSIVPGAKESFESIRLIFDPIEFKTLYAMSLTYKFEVLWPNDGEMQNMLLGLQNHSSFHPSPYSLFSQYSSRNQPDIVRTVETILQDNQKRLETGEGPNLHHSVAARPIQALIDHPNNNNLRDVLTIAPLHNLTLIVNTFIGMACKLNLDVTSDFISNLPFTRSRHQGNELVGFAGEHCQIISKSMPQLRNRLPPLAVLNQSRGLDSNSKDELRVDYASPQFTFLTFWKLTDVIEALNHLIHAVTTAKLYPDWREVWNNFQVSWNVFSDDYLRIFPSRNGRHLVSPKIHNILVHLPSYLEEHQHSLFRCHEQAFETFHQKFKVFESRFPFPKVEFWVPPPKKSSTATATIHKGAPSFSTRSGNQQKRQKKASNTEAAEKRKQDIIQQLLSLAPDMIPFASDDQHESAEVSADPQPRRRTNVRNIEKAQQGRFRAIIS